MVDLHCHILPNVDDGAASAAVACEMARHALRSGVDTIVATPHRNLYGARLGHRQGDTRRVLALFRALLRQEGIALNILPGAELFAHRSNLLHLLKTRCYATLNHSRYLLVEFNFTEDGREISELLSMIAHFGLVPVVAHPERYFAVQDDPALVADWFARGYVIQLNKGSLLGRLGQGAHDTSLFLLHGGLAHVIASDAHDPVYRPTGFVSLLRFLEQECPPPYTRLLLEDNPRRIISDRPIRGIQEVTP